MRLQQHFNLCNTVQNTATHYNTLQHNATHCDTHNTLHHTAPHCTTLHHTAPHCTTLHHTTKNTYVFTCTHKYQIGATRLQQHFNLIFAQRLPLENQIHAPFPPPPPSLLLPTSRWAHNLRQRATHSRAEMHQIWRQICQKRPLYESKET